MGEKKPLPFRGGVGVGTVKAHESLGSRTLAPTPSPSPRGEGLREIATRLAGLTGAILGWRPHEFWNATPAELATILTALAPDAGNAADRDLIMLLQEQFPDG